MKQSVFRKVSLCVALLSVTIATASPLQAEERVLTLQQILATARENNGDLQALRWERGIIEAGRIRVGLRSNPVLDLEVASGALTGSLEENRISIGVSQEFLTGGKRARRLAVADSELDRFAARLKELERLSLLEVKLGFYDLQSAQARVDLADKASGLSDQLLLVTRERLAAGDIAELEVNLAKVESARAAGSKFDAMAEVDSARLRLLALMGGAAGEDFKIAAAAEPRPLALNLAELKALALKNRADLQLAQLDSAKGEAELLLAQADAIPNLTAGIGISRESSLTSLGALEEKDTEYLVALTLSVPIPVFDKNQAGIKEARTRVSSSLNRRALLSRSIELEVEAARTRFAASERSLNLYAKEIIPQLSENLKLLQEAYQLGEVGIAAVIEEQKKFQEVNEGHLLALQQRNSAFARLEAAVGVELNAMNGGMQ